MCCRSSRQQHKNSTAHIKSKYSIIEFAQKIWEIPLQIEINERKYWELITKLLRNDCCKGFHVIEWSDIYRR